MKENDILKVCGATFFARGLSYREQGRVLDLDWDPEDLFVAGMVSGSGGKVYRQAIELMPGGRTDSFEGDCSCPVGFNCKHVVAVMLEWLARGDAIDPGAPAGADPAGGALRQWQADTETLLRTEAAASPPEGGETCIIYRLQEQKVANGSRWFLDTQKSRRLKKGGWGKGSHCSLTQLLDSYYMPRWATPLDLEIAQLAGQGGLSSMQTVIAGDIGLLMLKRLLRSGRCFFREGTDEPLREGPPRKATFEWIEEGRGLTRMRIGFEGGEDGCSPMATDPPWYLDSENNCCGPIEQPLSSSLFEALCRLPPLSAEQLPELSYFLSTRLPQDSVPLPVDLDLKVCEQPPVPVLRLFGTPSPKGHTCHVARVRFAYGPCELPPGAPEGGGSPQLIRCHEEDWLVHRDLVAEDEHLRAIMEYGFAPAASVGVAQPGEWDLVFTAGTLEESAAAWRRFLGRLPQLGDDGWRVVVEDSFVMRFEEAGSIVASIDDSETDWFDIGLGLEYEGRRLQLLPLLVQWLENREQGQPLLLSVADGTWLEVPATVLEPVLGTLVELYQDPVFNEQGQLRLPRPQACCLSSVEGQLAREGHRFSWEGGEKVRALAESLNRFSGIEAVEPPAGLKTELRCYQLQGLAWLQFLRSYGFGGILADDMGLGKTVQALAHLLSEKETGRLNAPALIVAPTSVLGNWQREAARFTPALRTLVLHGPSRVRHFETLSEYDLIITSYGLLGRDGEHYLRHSFHTLILDEAQAIKNPRAKTTRAACAIKAEHRLCLTGTPMENHLGELWSLLHFLMPGFLGTQEHFNRLFRNPIEKRQDAARQEALQRRVAPFMLRRDKEQVATELPPKTIIIRDLELTGGQARLYESIRVAMSDRIGSLLQSKGLSRSHIEILDALLKLRQVCCDPRLVKLDSAKNVKQSGKLDLLLDMLTELMEEGRKVLLFSQFTSMLGLIEPELKARNIDYCKLTGRTRKRDEVIDRFQSGEVPLFLISLKAGGVGLNLTAADTVIHYDPWWNPAVEKQATDRAYRIGQDKPVFVYKLVAANTVEEKILQMQHRKEQLAGAIYKKGQQGQLPELSAEEILSLLAPVDEAGR